MKTDKSGQGKENREPQKGNKMRKSNNNRKSFCASCAFLWLTSFS